MIAEPYRTWVDRLEKTLAAVRSVGGRAGDLVIKPPATEAEILGTERKIGRRLPASFRQVLLEFSGEVWMDWYGPPETLAEGIGRELRQLLGSAPVDPRRELPMAELGFSLDGVAHADDVRRRRYQRLRQWSAENETRAWVVPLPMARSVGWWSVNGDVLAFTHDAVVWWERSEFSAQWLAPDFIEFMERWTRIGCVGPYRLGRLVGAGETGLDPDCDLAVAWREAMGLDF